MAVYQYLVRNLIYLDSEIRPDIDFNIRQLSCHNSDLQIGHLRITKQDFPYFKKTSSMKIIYRRNLVNY